MVNGHFLTNFRFWLLWVELRKSITLEFTEFATRVWKMANWVMLLAFIWIGKYFHYLKKKILVLSKAKGFLSAPYLVIDNLSVLSISIEVLALDTPALYFLGDPDFKKIILEVKLNKSYTVKYVRWKVCKMIDLV